MIRFVKATSIALLVAIGSCSEPPAPAPLALVLEMNPSGRAPLAGTLKFTTEQPTRATVVISDGEDTQSVTPDDAFTTDHDLLLLGFRPDREHTVEVSLENQDGRITLEPVATFSVKTPALSDAVPPVDVLLSRPAVMEPGVTLLPMFQWLDFDIVRDYGLIMVLDAQGEIVWLYESPINILHAIPLSNGNILASGFGFSLTEIDMLGNVVQEWHPTGTITDAPPDSIAVNTDTMHHNYLELPSGNFMAISTEVREMPNWYTSDLDPGAPRDTRNVIGDILIEFEPDGTIVNEWKFFDLIDPYRIGYNSLSTDFYEDSYADILDEPAHDWTHSNGIHYDEATNTALVSTNHLSTVMNLDLETGELLWMLGDPVNWREPWSDLLLEPENDDMIWSYHHHAPQWTPHGTMLLYDNGAVRALPFDPPLTPEESFSRAVEYEIDAANGTVREVWSYGGPGDELFLSPFVSEADWLPQTEHILVTSGGRVRDNAGNPVMSPLAGHPWIAIAEVTHTMPAEKVWEIRIDDPRAGWSVFRSERLPSLYWAN